MSTWRGHRAHRNSLASSIAPPGGEGWTIRDYQAILRSEPYASADLGATSGRDRQVSTVRGCVSLLAESDLTPTHDRRHRGCARCARAVGRQHRLGREPAARAEFQGHRAAPSGRAWPPRPGSEGPPAASRRGGVRKRSASLVLSRTRRGEPPDPFRFSPCAEGPSEREPKSRTWLVLGSPGRHAASSTGWSRHAGHVVRNQGRSTVRTPGSSFPCSADHSLLQRAPSSSMRRWDLANTRLKEGSTKIRGVKRRDRLPSEGRASVRGRRLDVQPSMSATLTPRILLLPKCSASWPAISGRWRERTCGSSDPPACRCASDGPRDSRSTRSRSFFPGFK